MRTRSPTLEVGAGPTGGAVAGCGDEVGGDVVGVVDVVVGGVLGTLEVVGPGEAGDGLVVWVLDFGMVVAVVGVDVVVDVVGPPEPLGAVELAGGLCVDDVELAAGPDAEPGDTTAAPETAGVSPVAMIATSNTAPPRRRSKAKDFAECRVGSHPRWSPVAIPVIPHDLGRRTEASGQPPNVVPRRRL
jgi:hypothetical protein